MELFEQIAKLYEETKSMALANAEKSTGQHRKNWQLLAKEMESRLETIGERE